VLSDEDRRRIQEEELHRYQVRERLEAPRRRKRWLWFGCAVALLFLCWLGSSILGEADRVSTAAYAADVADRMRAYETASGRVREEKAYRSSFENIAPRIAPFSPRYVNRITGAGRYRVEVIYQVFESQETATYAVRCSVGLCQVE
jgi:hypothetical protein